MHDHGGISSGPFHTVSIIIIITRCSSRFLVHIATILPRCHTAHHQDSLVGLQETQKKAWAGYGPQRRQHSSTAPSASSQKHGAVSSGPFTSPKNGNAYLVCQGSRWSWVCHQRQSRHCKHQWPDIAATHTQQHNHMSALNHSVTIA
jgi:hypothetical protein